MLKKPKNCSSVIFFDEIQLYQRKKRKGKTKQKFILTKKKKNRNRKISVPDYYFQLSV